MLVSSRNDTMAITLTEPQRTKHCPIYLEYNIILKRIDAVRKFMAYR